MDRGWRVRRVSVCGYEWECAKECVTRGEKKKIGQGAMDAGE